MGIFTKKYKMDEKEIELTEIIKSMCEKDDVDIRFNPSNHLQCFISLKNAHYDVVILPKSVVFANSKFFSNQAFPIDFIEKLIEIPKERATKDRNKVLENIMNRERNMLNEIKSSLL